ncbi:MAG TPA: hypothetical protein VGF89_06410 [Steroidobacteraceae bacterium]|jgi:hypothetical protein
MSAVPAILDEETQRLGLLMETAQSQQQTIDQCLQQLAAHAHNLDEVVRDSVDRAAEQFCHRQRAAALRMAWWTAAIGALPNVMVATLLVWAVPSPERIARLQDERARLSMGIARLAASGGRIDLRRCGDRERLCVRVDRQAPAYGDQSDYLVVRGY